MYLVFQAPVWSAPAALSAVHTSGTMSAGGAVLHQRSGSAGLHTAPRRESTPQVTRPVYDFEGTLTKT